MSIEKLKIENVKCKREKKKDHYLFDRICLYPNSQLSTVKLSTLKQNI
jgi:hypothetical protein